MASIHASCVSFDGIGVLIRGASGAGKSRLAHIMVLRGPLYGRTTQLVSDDRTILETRDGVLYARAPEALAGLLEIRGLGLARLPFAPEAAVGLVVDLAAAADIPRFPEPGQCSVEVGGVTLPRALAHSPETALDAVLSVLAHNHISLELYEPLASRHQDGKSTLS